MSKNTVTVEVDVEVPLGDIESEDLVGELYERVQKRQVVGVDMGDLFEACADNFDYKNLPELKSLDDKEKFILLMSVFGKYSTSQIEAALPV